MWTDTDKIMHIDFPAGGLTFGQRDPEECWQRKNRGSWSKRKAEESTLCSAQGKVLQLKGRLLDVDNGSHVIDESVSSGTDGLTENEARGNDKSTIGRGGVGSGLSIKT